jgi:hypothetical protein
MIDHPVLQRFLASPTEHPGGWQDIVNFLESSGTDAYSALLQRLNEAARSYTSTGILAGVVFRALRDFGLPNPGDKRWLQPCAKWPAPVYSAPKPKAPDTALAAEPTLEDVGF